MRFWISIRECVHPSVRPSGEHIRLGFLRNRIPGLSLLLFLLLLLVGWAVVSKISTSKNCQVLQNNAKRKHGPRDRNTKTYPKTNSQTCIGRYRCLSLSSSLLWVSRFKSKIQWASSSSSASTVMASLPLSSRWMRSTTRLWNWAARA